MGSLSSLDWGIKYLSCMIDVFAKYAWVKSLKDKEAETVLNDFIKIIIEPKRKPNKS